MAAVWAAGRASSPASVTSAPARVEPGRQPRTAQKASTPTGATRARPTTPATRATAAARQRPSGTRSERAPAASRPGPAPRVADRSAATTATASSPSSRLWASAPARSKHPRGVDGAGQGLVAQQLDGPEVADRVEEDQQRPRPDGPGRLGRHHRPEHRRRAAAEQPGALLQRRRELAQAGRHRQVHVRVGEQGEHVQRAPEPLEGGQPLHPERARAARPAAPRGRRRPAARTRR